MRVLVTGGAGFIGSHFARRLAASGEDVVVLDKLTYAGDRANLESAEVAFHLGDIADPLMFIESLPSGETRSYVQRVMASYWIYQQRLGEATSSLDAVASGRWPTYAKLDGSTAKVAANGAILIIVLAARVAITRKASDR